ncbi:MAG TPA: flagellar motor protein MotB [Arthrobacter sp.]
MEEHHVDERWMASYMDMVTVLMCLFIVLFAMSTVDVKKYDQLKNSLATGFGVEDTGKIDNAVGIIDKTAEPPAETVAGESDIKAAEHEVDKLTALRDQMNANLNGAGLGGTVTFVIDQRGLTVKLVGSQSYFLPDSPVLQEETIRILGAIAPVIAPIPEEIAVEGHCANLYTAYSSTWELSSARATAVLRNLVETGGVAGKRIGAVGYGSARQVNNDITEAEHEENRRVDVVVMSDQEEKIRALIPQVMAARGK